MSTVEITEANFEAIVKKDGIVLLDWWAGWCRPCRAFAPVFEAAAKKHVDITFGKIDTEAEQALAGAFNIRSIPTLMVLRDGVLLAAQAGALPAEVLDDLIGKVRAIDMEEVRRQIADEKSGNNEAREDEENA